jgi:hypothetical protein
MTLDEILSDLENKVFFRATAIHELTKVEQVVLENDCTEILKKLLVVINKQCLRNFSLRLEMDPDKDDLDYRNHHTGRS